MRVIKLGANALLSAAALLGLLCALMWGASAAGLAQPLVVTSGSMEPTIATGDLLLARRTPVADLAVGDVVTLRSAVTGSLVTHRITEVTLTAPDVAEVRMRGDANAAVDNETYVVARAAWQPVVRAPGGGFAVMTLTRPAVALPLLVAIGALIALTLVPSRPDGDEPEDDEPDDDGRDDDERADDGHDASPRKEAQTA